MLCKVKVYDKGYFIDLVDLYIIVYDINDNGFCFDQMYYMYFVIFGVILGIVIGFIILIDVDLIDLYNVIGCVWFENQLIDLKG